MFPTQPSHSSVRRPEGRIRRSGAAFQIAASALPVAVGMAWAVHPNPSLAEGDVCGLRHEVVSRLGTGYGETRRAFGLQRDDAVLEVFASAETGSWTIIVSSPDGVSCLVASGRDWAATDDEARTGEVGDRA